MAKISRTKKIDGKKFWLQTKGAGNKLACKNTAKWLRKQEGHEYARVVKVKRGYAVYTRSRSAVYNRGR